MRNYLIWIIFAFIAGYPVVYLGFTLDFPDMTLPFILIWGAVIAGVAVAIDRETR